MPTVRYKGFETGRTAPPDAGTLDDGSVDLSEAVEHWPEHDHPNPGLPGEFIAHESTVLTVEEGHWLLDQPDWQEIPDG